MKLRHSIFATTALLLSAAASASGSLVTVDLNALGSWDGIGDSDNVVLTVPFAPGATITGIGWDVTITPMNGSWYSEATAGISDSGGGQSLELVPGALDGGDGGDGIARAYSSAGIMDLTDNGLSDLVLADGLLVIEFFESFDDAPGAIDSIWNGTLSFQIQAVPLPAAVWLLASGLLGLLGWRRRRA